MRHYILAKFQADAGDWHGYLPRIREIFGAAGEIPGVRGAAVYPGCVDRENRYHVLIELEMEPSALTGVMKDTSYPPAGTSSTASSLAAKAW